MGEIAGVAGVPYTTRVARGQADEDAASAAAANENHISVTVTAREAATMPASTAMPGWKS